MASFVIERSARCLGCNKRSANHDFRHYYECSVQFVFSQRLQGPPPQIAVPLPQTGFFLSGPLSHTLQLWCGGWSPASRLLGSAGSSRSSWVPLQHPQSRQCQGPLPCGPSLGAHVPMSSVVLGLTAVLFILSRSPAVHCKEGPSDRFFPVARSGSPEVFYYIFL